MYLFSATQRAKAQFPMIHFHESAEDSMQIITAVLPNQHKVTWFLSDIPGSGIMLITMHLSLSWSNHCSDEQHWLATLRSLLEK